MSDVDPKPIPKTECKDRRLYKIRSRNLTFGIYQADTGGFMGLRHKFEDIYLFTEYHHDNGPPYGTVNPVKDLLVDLPTTIENVEGFSVCSKCSCPVRYVAWPEGGEREITLKSDPTKTMRVSGEWKHLTETPCQDLRPIHRENAPLRKWLEEQLDQYYKELQRCAT